MTLNKLKAAIAAKGSVVGTFLTVSTPSIVETLGYTGLDFVIIDTEHGPYDTMPMSDMIRAADSKGLSPVVRVGDVTHKEIQRALDNGAEGIIVPCLRDVDDFRRLVDLGKFAPVGNRGFIKGRGSAFGNEPWARGTLTEYMENSNEKVLLLPQCETAEALEHIEEIVESPGIDGIFIGPFDLSICMGIPAEFDRPEFQAAMGRVLQACKRAGKLCMTYTNTPEEARRYLAQGFDAVANNLDSVLYADMYRVMVDEIRR
ncbi:MAG: hypothetical protein IJH91_05330 [Mogibacterium sp.]|nr:hypothetical protein [Mogibacterium sp.]